MLQLCKKPKTLKDGEPCSHPGCLGHVKHPCEGCGRLAGIPVEKHDFRDLDGNRYVWTGEIRWPVARNLDTGMPGEMYYTSQGDVVESILELSPKLHFVAMIMRKVEDHV